MSIITGHKGHVATYICSTYDISYDILSENERKRSVTANKGCQNCIDDGQSTEPGHTGRRSTSRVLLAHHLCGGDVQAEMGRGLPASGRLPAMWSGGGQQSYLSKGKSLRSGCITPAPPTDNIWTIMVIVWRVRGEIIWPSSVLLCIIIVHIICTPI